jgi:hypothetical protein
VARLARRAGLTDVRVLDEEVERLALIDEGTPLCRHVDERAHEDLPGHPVDRTERLRQLLKALHGTLGQQEEHGRLKVERL